MSTGGASEGSAGGEPPGETSAAGRPKDLRVGSHRDVGVRVDRDLTGGGRLARGSTTGYSTLRFRSGPAAGTSDVAPAPAARAAKGSASAAVAPAAPASAASARATGAALVTEPVFRDVTDVTGTVAPAPADLPSLRPGPTVGETDARRQVPPAFARLARWFGRA